MQLNRVAELSTQTVTWRVLDTTDKGLWSSREDAQLPVSLSLTSSAASWSGEPFPIKSRLCSFLDSITSVSSLPEPWDFYGHNKEAQMIIAASIETWPEV